MVNNIWNILDEGENKYIDEYIMKDPEWFREFIDSLASLKRLRYEIEYQERQDEFDKYDDDYVRMKMAYDTKYDPFFEGYMNEERLWQIKKSTAIAEFMGATPFYPSVMINISPDWKGEFGKDNDNEMIAEFRNVIESYLNESIGPNKRFTKWKYCLECGSEGNFLHAHIVCELNHKILTSMKSHFGHNIHTQQLRKYCNKTKGMKGLLKGKYSVQRNLINTEEILEDKLNYLLEANKCEGHRNLKDLNLVFGDF